jgi:DNA-binding NarL/FixJ family response regulator
MTYKAKVTRGGQSHLWVIHIPGIRTTVQTRSLRKMDNLVSRLIHESTGEPTARIHIDYEVVLPRAVRERMARAKRLRQTAAQAQAKATEESRAVARYLHDVGMPLREIGRTLGLSHQRAHQLLG